MIWTVEPGEAGRALTGFVRGRLPDKPWSEIKRWIASGKLFIDGRVETGEGARVYTGQSVELRMAAPRRAEVEVRIQFEDPHLVVIDKPSGISSVPFETKETGTAMDLIRDAWRRMGRPATQTPLFVVHRIDKDTSGLIVYAKSKRAERELAAQFRAHTVERRYLCVAHGAVAAARIESRLVADRGDGLRGSTRFPDQGKRAVTHVEPMRRVGRATLCAVRLETGKTHQIRIHLSERGHPLVGETVYIRNYTAELLPSPRLLLHAETLAFVHPVTGARQAFEVPLPEDFNAAVRALEAR